MVKRRSYWFVECDPVANENLMRLLDSIGFGAEAPQLSRKSTDGKPYNVIHLPNELVTALKSAKGVDVERVLFQFKFFVSDTFNGNIRRANFIENRYKSKKVRDVERDLKKLKQKRSSGAVPF